MKLLGSIVFIFLFLITCDRGPSLPSGDLAFFIPGALSDTPYYGELQAGLEAGAAKHSRTVVVYEGGRIRSRWQSQIMELSRLGEYAYIVTVGPSMDEALLEVKTRYPDQEYIVYDGNTGSRPYRRGVKLSHLELAYLFGVYAGTVQQGYQGRGRIVAGPLGVLATPNSLDFLKKGVFQGLSAVTPFPQIKDRLVLSHTSTAEAARGARELYRNSGIILYGADIASQGVLNSAIEFDKFLMAYGEDLPLSPRVLASGKALVEKAAYDQTLRLLEGSFPEGSSVYLGYYEGYIDFRARATVNDLPLKNESLLVLEAEIEKLRTGQLFLR